MLGRCPECNKLFAMKKTGKKPSREEDIQILETLTQPHPKGEIQIMVEHFVPGKRTFYELTHQCRYCGYRQIKTICKDTKRGQNR
ncbi:MAG: hypothetical protein E7409_04210 [Ruminococcaceae bacterium]|nr:hypothetical protein [Oscillospiraceae bacterium]